MRMRIRMEELPNENENGIRFSQNHFSTSAASSDIHLMRSQCTWRLTFQPVSVFHGLSKGLNCVCERGCLADNVGVSSQNLQYTLSPRRWFFETYAP